MDGTNNAAVNKVNTEPAAQATTPAQAPQAAEPQGKTFSADYVHDLREESKGYRQTAKTYEQALRKALNIADGEEIGDIDKRIKAMQNAQTAAVTEATAKANARLISAEIKGLDGYDPKLLAKVIDYSKITIDDDGNVTGVKEAAEEAAKEYPAVIKEKTPAKYSGGTGSAPVGGEKYGKEIAAFRRAAGLK